MKNVHGLLHEHLWVFIMLSEEQLILCGMIHCFFYPFYTGNIDVASSSCSTSVTITAVVSCAVSFILGALVGAVVYYCTVWKKCDVQKTIAHKQKNQQPAPVYEEVVGLSQSQNIKLKENVAYGPVQQ